LRKIRKTTVLLAIFIVLTAIALITFYTVHQTPIEEVKTETLCSYESVADYDYLALIQVPNLVYDNKSVIGTEYETLYTRIVRHINLTLKYEFKADQPLADVQITYTVTRTIKASAWTYEIDATAPNTTSQTQIQISLPTINKTQLDQLKARIDAEIGTSTTTYTLEIKPTFTVKANTTYGKILQVFTPTLTVSFQRAEKGEITVIEPLHQSKAGAITKTEKLTNQGVVSQRYASYILITTALAGLAFSTLFYIRTKPTVKKPLEKTTAPYKDLIVETAEAPKTLPQTTITVKDLKELAKIAEILAKPIIHVAENGKHTFYIIDENVMYRFRVEAQSRES
jgi:cell division protein FtsL